MIEGFQNGLSDFLARVTLILWYVVAIYLVVLTLGITQYNGRLAILYNADDNSFARIEATQKKEADLNLNLFFAEQEVEDRNEEIERLRSQTLKLEAELNEAKSAALIAISDDAITKVNYKIDGLQRQVDLKKRTLAEILAPRIEAREALEAFQADLGEDILGGLRDYSRLVEEKDSITVYPFATQLFSYPQEVLTIILALSMGVFGSLIAVSRDYLKDGHVQNQMLEKRVAWFIFRPIQGAVMALSIFILLKAGVLVFAAPQSADQMPAELNPFVIAFLGVISGLFAERGYARLERAADEVFAAQDRPAAANYYRWSERADDRIQALDGNLEWLSAQLDLSLSRVQKFASHAMKMPEEIAKEIALRLDTTPDDIFDRSRD